MTPRQRFLAAAHCQPVDRPPIWLMRQAGRYLPEYRELKAAHDFVTMVRTPEHSSHSSALASIPLDAAIIFSDILVIPEALGQGYHFRDRGGIGMDYLLDHPDKIAALGATRFRRSSAMSAVRCRQPVANSAKTRLYSVSAARWTSPHMVEGGSSKDFTR